MTDEGQADGSVRFAPLPLAQITELAHLQQPPLRKGQTGPLRTLDVPPDAPFDLHKIVVDETVIGGLVIDPMFHLTDPHLPPGSHGLADLLIGGQYQRFDYGAAALSALPAYLKTAYPLIATLYVRVPRTNAPAIRAYGAAGWTDCNAPQEGADWHLMQLSLADTAI